MTTKTLDALAEALQALPIERRRAFGAWLRECAVSEDLKEIVAADPQLRTFSLAEVAEALDVSERSLLRYIHAGRLRAVRMGRRYRVSVAALQDFVDGRDR